MNWHERLRETLALLKHLQAFQTLPPEDHASLDVAITCVEAILSRSKETVMMLGAAGPKEEQSGA